MFIISEHQQTQKSTESKSTVQKPAPPRIQAPSSHPMAIIQRARMNPKSLTHADVMQLQSTIGNRAVVRLLTEIGAIPSRAKQAPPVQRQEMVQRQEIPEEEEPLQGKMAETVQRQEIPEEEEPLQGKFEIVQRQEIPEEEEPLQGKFESKPEIACPSCFAAPIVQRQEIPEEEPLQGKMIETVQRQEIPEEEEPLQTKRENNTGMPDNLKAGVENLSGIDMSDVRVHYNSSKPAEVGALAYTQGTNIHVAPGQERHLPHEAWHVVQQMQGRVKPTMQMKGGISLNDDAGLEHESDEMGKKAFTMGQNKFFRQGMDESEVCDGHELITHELIHTVQHNGSAEQRSQQHEQGLEKKAILIPTKTDQRIRHHIISPYSVLQGIFEGSPHESEVERQASEHGLEMRQINILKMAASVEHNFGTLKEYLENPAKIEEVIIPIIIRADRQLGEEGEGEEDEMSVDEDSELQLGEGEPLIKRRTPPFEPTSSSLPLIKSRSIMFSGEEIRGTHDLPEDSDEELEEFGVGLSEGGFWAEELELLNKMLLERQAPHDRQRREIITEFWQQRKAAIEAEECDYFDEPYLEGSDEESGTDTEGSDTADDEDFCACPERQNAAKKRSRSEVELLKPKLFRKRLTEIQDSDKSKRDSVMFAKGKKPVKIRFFRKEPHFRLPSLKVRDRAKLPYNLTDQQKKDMATLNELLTLGIPINVAEQLMESKFVVAQYRGLFYARSSFSHQTREQHRHLDERDQPVFSSSALAEGQFRLGGYYYLYNDPSRREDLAHYQNQLMQESIRIRHALLALREKEPTEEMRETVGRATDRFRPSTMADLSTHLYSQEYYRYHKSLAEFLKRDKSGPPQPLDPIFQGLPNASNPKVSTGDVPTHAARYAFGLKAYQGHEEDVLEPEYDEKGKPKHPYSGKMYVSIHPLTDYEEASGPSQLVSLQKEGRINLSKVIIPEYETQFDGFLEKYRIKRQFKAKFPNFSKPYKEVYQEKYGLDSMLFKAFQDAFQSEYAKSGTVERVFIEALLSNYLAMRSEQKAINAAIEEATRQNATLVYRTGPHSFGFLPPELPMKASNPQPSELANPQEKQPDKVDLVKLLKELIEKNEEFRKTPDEVSSHAEPDIRMIESTYGNIIQISGEDIACYIRSLVTAASKQGFFDETQIEQFVQGIQDHLQFVRLRTRGQMINAGGIVAAEVRRSISQLTQRRDQAQFDPEVHIVMWDNTIQQITDFQINAGIQQVWLYYAHGHFNLINKH